MEGNTLESSQDASPTDPLVNDPEPVTFKEMAAKWPKSTFCIIGNEFCERFSFYGMRTVMMLYLMNILKYNSNEGTAIYHLFTLACYTSPLLGSMLADGFIGKFWTIFTVSILYTFGQILLAFSASFGVNSAMHPTLDLIGFFVVALGTGGIKPCVSAFGGDQFKPHYKKMIALYFSIFYFSINAGSTLSSVLTPILRATPCLGVDSCFPLAFGVPAALMIVATVIFMLGSFAYKRVPPKDNVLARVVRTISLAVKNKMRDSQKRDSWVEHALDNHICEDDKYCVELAEETNQKVGDDCAQAHFVDDIRRLGNICVMMLPVPMFWALYDQQGSTWVVQALAMDAELWSGVSLLPDQMITLNAILIMVFIPVFQGLIFPVVEKCGIRTTSLRRMAAGGVLAAVSFFICGLVQIRVDQTMPDLPGSDESFISVINTFPTCEFDVYVSGSSNWTLKPNSSLEDDKVTNKFDIIRLKDVSTKTRSIVVSSSAPNCPNFNLRPMLSGGHSYNLLLTPLGWSLQMSDVKKPQGGDGQFGISLNLLIPCSKIPSEVTWPGCKNESETYDGVLALCKIDGDTNPDHPCNPKESNRFYTWKPTDMSAEVVYQYRPTNYIHHFNVYKSIDPTPGTYQLYFVKLLTADSDDKHPGADQTQVVPVTGVSFTRTRMGASYAMTVSGRERNSSEWIVNFHTKAQPNHVSILWQVPQYAVITAAEILFSITGLEFAYAEASPQLKSVVQAIWLLTVGGGNFLVVVIAWIQPFEGLAPQMFFCGVMMLLVIGIFILLAVFYYKYAEYGVVKKPKRTVSKSTSMSERNSSAETASEVDSSAVDSLRV